MTKQKMSITTNRSHGLPCEPQMAILAMCSTTVVTLSQRPLFVAKVTVVTMRQFLMDDSFCEGRSTISCQQASGLTSFCMSILTGSTGAPRPLAPNFRPCIFDPDKG